MGALYPLTKFTRDEAVKVVAFGMHRRPRSIDDGDGIRAGFVILGVIVAGLVLLGLIVVGLVLWVRP